MDGEQVAAGGPGGDAGGPTDEGLPLGAAGEGDDDAFPGLPDASDAVVGAVALEGLVDPLGQPQQGQLAQGGEVADAEVVGQGRVDLLGRVDVAVRHPAAQRLGGHVDELDLMGAADDLVRHGLVLRHAGDLLDDVAEGLEVLDVDGGDDVDSGGEELFDVLPAFGVAGPGAGRVGVGEFVDEGDLGAAAQDGPEVQLGALPSAAGVAGAGHDLEALEHLLGVRAVVALGESHDDVGAAEGAAPALVQHAVGLAHAGGGAEEDFELAGGWGRVGHGVLLRVRGP